MRKIHFAGFGVALAAVLAFLTGCPNNNVNPNNPAAIATNTFTPTPSGPTATPTNSLTPTITPTPTDTSTPCGFPGATCTPTPQNITITIQNGSLGGGYSGFYYSSSAGSNNSANGLFSLSCHVNDIVNLPSGGLHTLWFDNGGSGTCITGFSGETSPSMAYTFSSAGTYYFQCGNHANCANKASCSPTTCTAMAAVVNVSP